MATSVLPPLHAKKFNTELTDYSVGNSAKSGQQYQYGDNLEVDALIVGAGFAGIFMLKTLRDRGFKTVIFEAGNDIGGTWRWNCYPGAGVDSEIPEYEFSWPEVWKTWSWSTNYPDYAEIRAYFDHVDKVVGVKKDCAFNTVVVGGSFDTAAGRWTVKTQDGRTTRAKYLILGTGFAARRYIPDWPGMDKFGGHVHHSSFWPDHDMDVSSKRCAIIGTGASGVQLTQAWGPLARHLTVFQRTPNLALPGARRSLTALDQDRKRDVYPQLFSLRETSFAGFHYDWYEKRAADETPAEREALHERIWRDGGFRFWLANYKDHLFSPEANSLSYDFWARKTRERIHDPAKRDLLAPLEMPHYFGTKRPSLERCYYDQFNRPNVDVVDIRDNPIREFTETGITLQDGTHHELDVVAVATGFDVVTGAMTQLGLKSIYNTTLQEEWASGIDTYLGATVRGYPNMFHIYGPHAPTLFSNGPAAIEIQGRFVGDMIGKLERQGIKYFNPTAEASQEWKKLVSHLSDITLFPHTRSTYMGGAVPGKKVEAMCFTGGLPLYRTQIRAAYDSLDGFELVKA